MTEPLGPGDPDEAQQGAPPPIPDPPDTDPVEDDEGIPPGSSAARRISFMKEQSMAQTPADLNRSWDHAEARHDIAQALGGKTGAPFKEQAEILGPELTGKAIALGYFGAPGTRKDTKYELADPFGGYWGVSTDGYGSSFDTTVWQASKAVHTEHTSDPTDTLAVGTAHGLNNELDGPE